MTVSEELSEPNLNNKDMLPYITGSLLCGSMAQPHPSIFLLYHLQTCSPLGNKMAAMVPGTHPDTATSIRKCTWWTQNLLVRSGPSILARVTALLLKWQRVPKSHEYVELSYECDECNSRTAEGKKFISRDKAPTCVGEGP
jgi:hypothetical protein